MVIKKLKRDKSPGIDQTPGEMIKAGDRTIRSEIHIPWSRVLEKLTGLQLVKKFPAFYGTQ
jgi:hypothetical protein